MAHVAVPAAPGGQDEGHLGVVQPSPQRRRANTNAGRSLVDRQQLLPGVSGDGNASALPAPYRRPLALDPRLQVRGAKAELAAAAHDAQAALMDGIPQQARPHAHGDHRVGNAQRAS